MVECVLCGSNTAEHPDILSQRFDTPEFSCTICGDYAITNSALGELGPTAHNLLIRKRIRRYIYETRNQGCVLICVTASANYEAYNRCITLEQAGTLYLNDGTALEKYERTITRIANATQRFRQQFDSVADRWLIPTMEDEEAFDILYELIEDGHVFTYGIVHPPDPQEFRITSQGLAYAAQLADQRKSSGSQVFVAACFSEELRSALDAIAVTLEELGYSPKIVGRDAHNNLIDLEIYQGIRESKFVIADMTCNRQSVYYEVGFAHGLGLEVILTCRKDHFDHETDDWKRVHFDLNHRNILIWETEAQLAELLKRHIWRVFGRRTTQSNAV